MKIEEINTAKHILIVTDNAAFAVATALYTYLLTLHKKVSISNSEKIEEKLSFLPWFEKLREVKPSSAEYVIEAKADTLFFVKYCQVNSIKINKKMATSLYTALMLEYENFTSPLCDGIIFALASQLIELGAESQKVCKNLTQRVPLSTLRLKALILENMLLKESATHAELFVTQADLKATGATLKESHSIMKEALALVHVKKVTLIQSDENSKILQIIKEI